MATLNERSHEVIVHHATLSEHSSVAPILTFFTPLSRWGLDNASIKLSARKSQCPPTGPVPRPSLGSYDCPLRRHALPPDITIETTLLATGSLRPRSDEHCSQKKTLIQKKTLAPGRYYSGQWSEDEQRKTTGYSWLKHPLSPGHNKATIRSPCMTRAIAKAAVCLTPNRAPLCLCYASSLRA